MLQIELNMYQAVAVAALVLLLGRFLVSKIPFLTKYCIPEPVVGGVVYAVVHLILRSAGILEISFDNTLQSFFMTVFFCSVGYTACFRLLKIHLATELVGGGFLKIYRYSRDAPTDTAANSLLMP